MKKMSKRSATTLCEVLLVVGALAILFELSLPALARTRAVADHAASKNNLKQLGLALHNYHDTNGVFPPGNDDNNFSAFAKLLPYIEQGNLYASIDFKKPMDDKANADARKTIVKTFLNPQDSVKAVNEKYGGTNYFLCAGAKPGLVGNNGLFFQNSKVKFTDVTDGTSNTMMAAETLKGDSAAKATTVKRQNVLLKKEDLKDIKNEAGVKDWENNKNIAADRGASWMDGRFLQGTFTATRSMNDEKPDVNCAGFGGLSAVRSDDETGIVLLADGSVKALSAKVKLDVWKALGGINDGIPLPDDLFKSK